MFSRYFLDDALGVLCDYRGSHIGYRWVKVEVGVIGGRMTLLFSAVSRPPEERFDVAASVRNYTQKKNAATKDTD